MQKADKKVKKMKSITVTLLSTILILSVLVVISMGTPTVIAEENTGEGRTGQDIPAGGSPTVAELAAAILTPSTAPMLVSASKTGVASQFEVYTTSLQGFPTDDTSWALISTGMASSIAGTATTFYSYDTGGPSASGWSHRGHTCYDIATLSLTFFIPPDATTLSFNWKFATEENPTYTWSFRDTAKAIVTTSAGSINILLLPDGEPVDVGTASLFSNSVTGSSSSPSPPYPSPNDVIYNAVTPIYIASFNVAPYVGETIRIEFQIGGEGDRILDSALFIDNFAFSAFARANMYLSMNAPASMDQGNTMTYTLYYNNFGSAEASNVVLQATLPSNVDFVSASDDGTYDSATRRVTWNIGSVPAFPSGRGSRTITVRIPSSIPVGTVIQTTASISTSTLETRYDDDSASAQTTVTGSNLPPNVSVGPTLGNLGGTPSVYWGTPITFTYYNPTAIGVDIRIHINDGGPDITGSMTGGPPVWTYTTTFYPRHGHATATYRVNDPTPYFADFDLQNMRGFEDTITAAEIENYIQTRDYSWTDLDYSPMLDEAGIEQRFIDAGRTYHVNPAFLVATAEIEGRFGAEGWAASHPEAHNTMGWAVPYDDTPVVWEAGYYWVPSEGMEVYLYRNAFDSWGDCIENVASRIEVSNIYYGGGYHTVREIRLRYVFGEINPQEATQEQLEAAAVQGIIGCMNALAESAGQAGEFDEDFNLYIDPAGYIYDVDTLERISGASVWLQRPDGQGGWENVPTGQTPPIMQPDVNPQITGADGQYQWDVLEGSYRVHVEALGYYPADSIVVSVPPPVTDLHVGLTPLPDDVPPTATALILPANGSTTSDNTPTFDWSDVADSSGVTYTLEVIGALTKTGLTASTYTLTSAEALADGTYSWHVRAVDGAGNVGEWSTTWSLTIETVVPPPPSPDFVLSISPRSGSVTQGESTVATITASAIDGYNRRVTLSASGVPRGTTISFSPSFRVPFFNSTMTVTTSWITLAGSYTIKITGTGADGKVHSTTYNFEVTGVKPRINRILEEERERREMENLAAMLVIIMASFLVISISKR